MSDKVDNFKMEKKSSIHKKDIIIFLPQSRPLPNKIIEFPLNLLNELLGGVMLTQAIQFFFNKLTAFTRNFYIILL